jgi:hypothetical protein
MKVGMEVNSSILKNTTKCKNNFSCLTGEKECLCEVVLLFFVSVLRGTKHIIVTKYNHVLWAILLITQQITKQF